MIDFEPKPGQELGPHGSNGYIGRWTDLSGLKLKRMRMAHCKFLRIRTGRDTGLAARENSQFSRCDLRGASFELCDLTDANFKEARLEGASFPQSTSLDMAKFEGASWSSYRPPAKRASAEANRSWWGRAVGKAIVSELAAQLQGGGGDDDEGDGDHDDHGDDDEDDGGGGGEGSARAQWGKVVDETLSRKLGSLVAAVARFVPAMEAVRDDLKKEVLEQAARVKEPTQRALQSKAARAALRGGRTAAECQSLLKAVIEPVLKRAVDELLKEVLERKLPSLLRDQLQELIKAVGLPDAPALPVPHADADAAGDGGGGAAEVGGGGSAGERETDEQMAAGERDTSSVRELLQALVADIGTEALRAAVAAKTSELVSSAAELVASMAEPALRRLRTVGSELRAQVAPDVDEESGLLLGGGMETVGQAVAMIQSIPTKVKNSTVAGRAM